jgi:uncharacterized protein YbcI
MPATVDHQHDPVSPDHSTHGSDRGRMASAVSNAIVRLFAEYLGRGPTKARAIVTGTAIMVILEETLTKAERKLIESGMGSSVRETRRLLQDTMRDEMVAAVEDLTGRRVIGFLSDHQLDPDVSMESFVFERRAVPDGDGTASDGDGTQA